MRKPWRIAIILDLNDYYCRDIFMGMREFFRTHEGWVCETINPTGNTDWDWLSEGEWDGIVAYANHKLLRYLEKAGLPCINVSNSSPPGGSVPRVVNDDYAVGVMAAEHFLERGFRFFAFFGLKKAHVSQLRQAGFEETIEKAGYKCEDLPLEFQPTKGRNMIVDIPGMEARIAEGRYPLGVFGMNDAYARLVIGCCAAHGIRVPEQMGVLGADDSDSAAYLAEIPFSSVQLQGAKIGYTSMEKMEEMLNGKKKLAFPIMLPPKGVTVRASSDLIAVADPLVAHALQLIRERAFQAVQVAAIVRKLGVSRRKIEKHFRKALGRSPYEEVLRLRLEKAKTLLSETNLPISEIAEASGFSEPKLLHGLFTRQIKMTPTAYREKFRVQR